METAIKVAPPAIVDITPNPVIDLQKYIELENVNLVSHYPPAATKSGISIGLIIAGIFLAILLFKR